MAQISFEDALKALSEREGSDLWCPAQRQDFWQARAAV